ncbi:hypothetical protein PYCCODRAFT_1456975 [Trametes coccinea BRFM310]|uniref:RBR-type E3 ubiquitin transferase n=1 Tax=Trametes coccinea (strain BRFM310) TaxID=1353009 RepID=A0A1Y2IY03_TRAC3|nr:hypothetical protein PYCCODRAFT_1456975 [Trametes coccinea BRFM310]
MLHRPIPRNGRMAQPSPGMPLSPIIDKEILELLKRIPKSSPSPARNGRTSTSSCSRTSAGKAAQARLDDEELAFALFAEETAALAEAQRNDDYLDQLVLEEEMALYDHEVAVAISEGRDPPPKPAALERGKRVERGVFRRERRLVARFTEGDETPVLHLEEEPLQRFEEALRFALEDLDAEQSHAVSSTSDALDSEMRKRLQRLREEYGGDVDDESEEPSAPPTPPHPPVYSCAICGDDIDDDVIYLDCGHVLDRGCLTEMFRQAATDESLFPPKCCDVIELAEVEEHLDSALAARFQRKAREFTTIDRVYCHNPACATFLGPAAEEDPSAQQTFRCPECDAGTCASCKEQIHPGVPCHYPAEDVVLGLGKEKGWQRCPSCRHLVELSLGCYHMICRCNKQFCYLCAAPWKECNCELFYVPPEEGD